MQAILVHAFGGPEVLREETCETPRPEPGQVLVRLRAAGVNPVETYIRAGNRSRLPELPYIPGSDGAGDVVEVGAEVRGVQTGDRVYVAGPPTYAEYVCAPQDQVFSLPDAIDYAQGAAIGVPYGTAYRALRLVGRAQPGDWVLVHGASGAVGTAAMQIGAALGLRMIGTAGTATGLRHVAQWGAALGHQDLEQARDRTGGHGFDLIVEMAAHHNLGNDLPFLANRGRVVVVGSRAPVEINARDLMGIDGAILGLMLGNGPDDELSRIHQAIGAGLRNGTLRPVVGRRFALRDAAAAHRAVLDPGALGKIILEI